MTETHSTTPLSYASAGPAPPWWRRRWAKWAIGIVALWMVLSAPFGDCKQVESRMDAVTGTMTWRTTWMFGYTSTRVDVSALEKRLKASGIAWTADWRYLHNTHRNAFGRAIMHECGTAPPIYSYRSAIEHYAPVATDAELREFARVMQSGRAAEQEKALEAAAEKGLKTLVTK